MDHRTERQWEDGGPAADRHAPAGADANSRQVPGGLFPGGLFPGGPGGFPFPGGGPGFPGGPGGGPGPGFPGGPGGGPGPGFPGGPGGGPGFPGGPGGQAGPPSTPPPSFTPQMQTGPSALAVDPGAISACRFRFVYIWQRNGDQYWAYLTFVGRRSIAGFRWNGFWWQYFGLDLRFINQFRCF